MAGILIRSKISAEPTSRARTGFGPECSLEIEAVLAEETRQAVRILNPENVAPPIAAYSHLAIIPTGAELLVIAGQVGMGRDRTIPEEPEKQYELALRNIVDILASQGLTAASLIKLNIFLVDRLDPEHAKNIRTTILGSSLPPTTLVYVAGLARPELKVEIEGMAARSI